MSMGWVLMVVVVVSCGFKVVMDYGVVVQGGVGFFFFFLGGVKISKRAR